MLEIEKPKILVEENEDGTFAKFTVEPLERGYGITLGNCLRRTILSALPGAAAVGIRIAGVNHEFSSIKGVKEDVTDIVLNVKNIAIKTLDLNPDFRGSIYLKSNTPGELKAGDIQTNDQIEILNPDLHICTLDRGADFDMEIIVGRGRGYVPAVSNKSDDDPIGLIAVDSIFTPVKRVNYSVENTRVGQRIDFDKLVLEVETNGTLGAKEVVSLAGKIIDEYVMMFVSLDETMGSLNILKDDEQTEQSKVLEMSIEDMDLSVRSNNCLRRAGILTIDDLVKKSKDDMLKVKNLGSKSLDEIIKKLQSYGLNLRDEEE
ncbi:MAG: DNA-directed RNA polymerase subunit alpha [Clostridia bacterium]|nr:DNA-directed RNA polymerase subunit alpha [Clostridia bacterium]